MTKSEQPKVKIVMFDLDGTLVDSRDAYYEAVKTAFAEMRIGIPDPEVVTEIPKRLEQGLPLQDLLRGVDTQKFLEVYLRVYYRSTTAKSKLLPNISDALAKLSKKMSLVLITMRFVPQDNVVQELQKHGISEYFHHVATALDTCDPKPSPEALTASATRLGAKPSQCMVVGDSVVDIRMGKNAGAITVAVLSGLFSREELEREKPDHIIESVKHLPKLVEKMEKSG